MLFQSVLVATATVVASTSGTAAVEPIDASECGPDAPGISDRRTGELFVTY